MLKLLTVLLIASFPPDCRERLEIAREVSYAPLETFTRAGLSAYYRRTMPRIQGREVYFVVSSDAEFVSKLKGGEVFNVHTGPTKLNRKQGTGLAYLFRIDQNEFFIYVDAHDQFRSVTLRGRNVFSLSAGSAKVAYARQSIRQLLPPHCPTDLRYLVLIVSDLEDMTIDQIKGVVAHYDKMFGGYPPRLDLMLFNTCQMAAKYSDERLPILTDCTESPPTDEVWVTFLRSPDGNRFWTIRKNGKIVHDEKEIADKRRTGASLLDSGSSVAGSPKEHWQRKGHRNTYLPVTGELRK